MDKCIGSNIETQALKKERAEGMWLALEKIIPDVRRRTEVELVATPLTHEFFNRRFKGIRLSPHRKPFIVIFFLFADPLAATPTRPLSLRPSLVVRSPCLVCIAHDATAPKYQMTGLAVGVLFMLATWRDRGLPVLTE